MKNCMILAALVAALAALMFAGCGLLTEENKQKAIEYAESSGTAKLDQMVKDGDLTEKQAQKIKDAFAKATDNNKEE